MNSPSRAEHGSSARSAHRRRARLAQLGVPVQRLILRYLRQRIATADDPRRFGRALTGDLKGLWRYRNGDFRVVAAINDDQFLVLVVAVGHRREVYD